MAVFVAPHLVTGGTAPSYSQAPGSSSILNRLRHETRHEHDAVERVLDLMDPALTRNAYIGRLVQFYGFYAPMEAALLTRCSGQEGSSGEPAPTLSALLPRLHKTALLRQDLDYFGTSTKGLVLCDELPSIRTQAEVLGCLYVTEGATLGGRHIAQHIQVTLGITPTSGGIFFDGYAGGTAKMWQAMRQFLVSFAVDTETENAIVANAIATFASLRGWCEAANRLSNDDAEIQEEARQHE